MFVLNFNATKGDFETLEAKLRSAISPIRKGGDG